MSNRFWNSESNDGTQNAIQNTPSWRCAISDFPVVAMQTCEIAELAAQIAYRGKELFVAPRPFPSAAMAQYWTASKCRLDRWGRALRRYHQALTQRTDKKLAWRSLRVLCQEIMVSEMLTRVWSCLAYSLDSANDTHEAEPVASSVLSGHLEATNRVLDLISSNHPTLDGLQAELDRLRRLTERWTDLLLGCIGAGCEIARFAHDSARANDFADDFADSLLPHGALASSSLLLTSLRATYDRQTFGVAPNSDLNAGIAAAIVACFPDGVFDSTGATHWLWMLRLSATANEMQTLVEKLLSADEWANRLSCLNMETDGSS